MTKAEMVREISFKTGVQKKDVEDVIEALMVTVKDSLANGEEVYMRGFGSFIIKERAAKTARNIAKNTTVIIPAHQIPAFKPAKVFLEQMLGQQPSDE